MRQVPDPVEIDRKTKVIRVYENHPGFEDSISTSFGRYQLRFTRWDYRKSDFPACKIIDKVVIVNVDYPPFKNRKYGKIFLHLAILLIRRVDNGEIDETDMANILLDWRNEISLID